ncbi:DUF3078 domain-containing protein [Alistipes sp. ZOR0009]|uniref:DUF3078 domain-containing protein n=1 Tax=Alistipes sp. ZOR0009 TaxID=1339253 RepID=UPI0006475FEC|nr:DUF3078 domain-containing protein [Alistipes sp. ZOR0009]
MQRLTLLTVALMALCAYTSAQEAPKDSIKYGWAVKGEGSIGFSQVALSNWTAGGENTYSLNSIFNINAVRTWSKSIWQNGVNLGYGIQHLESKGTKKVNDQISLNSQFGYKASGHWYYSARANLQTQFANGYDYGVDPKKFTSQFFAPAFLITSLGMEFINKSQTLSILISPISAKYTFVRNDYLSSIGAFGVTPGEHSKSEVGAVVAAKYKKENIIKNVNIETSLQLFSSYNDKPQNIDVNWQMILFMKVNKYLATTLTTNLIYDDNVISKIQFKEILSVGLAYSF